MRGTFVRKQGYFSLRGLRTTRDAARVSACLNTNYWTPPREFPIQLIWGRTQIFAGFLNPQEGLILPIQGAHWEGCCPVGRDISPGTFFLASGECPRPGGGLCMAALRIHIRVPRLCFLDSGFPLTVFLLSVALIQVLSKLVPHCGIPMESRVVPGWN